MNENDSTVYTFQHICGYTGEAVTFTKDFQDMGEEHVCWPQVLSQFLRFLSMVYGYDIASKVAIEGNPQFRSEFVWEGRTFDPTEEEAKESRQLELWPYGGTD